MEKTDINAYLCAQGYMVTNHLMKALKEGLPQIPVWKGNFCFRLDSDDAVMREPAGL